MDLDLINRLLQLMDEGGLTELEWQDGERKVRLSKKGEAPALPPAVSYAQPQPAAAGAPAAPGAAPAEVEDGILIFRSPMVGTFYRSPSPEAEPFVQKGDQINPETVLCILEAMKVMNEIKAECSGEIVEVLLENGEPVEFDQPLFRIRPA